MPNAVPAQAGRVSPVDEAELAHQEHLERQVARQLIQSRVDRDRHRAGQLLAGATSTYAAGLRLALAAMGAVTVPLALVWFAAALQSFAPGLPGFVPGLIWATALVTSGLLLTDRRRPGAAGATTRARRASTGALISLPLITMAIVATAGSPTQGPVPTLLAGLLAAGLLVLPGFGVDEAARCRGLRLQRRADVGRADLAFLDDRGNGHSQCPRCTPTQE